MRRSGQGGILKTSLLRLLEKHLLPSALCPSHPQSLFFGRAGIASTSRSSSIFVQDPCFVVIAWFGLPHKRAIGWSNVCSEKGGQCFLTLRSVAFNSARFTLELEKHVFIHSFIHLHIHKHMVEVDVQIHTHAHTRSHAHVTHNSFGTNLTLLRAVFDFLKSSGSPYSPVTTTAEPLILSPIIVFQYQGKGGILTIALSTTFINKKREMFRSHHSQIHAYVDEWYHPIRSSCLMSPTSCTHTLL